MLSSRTPTCSTPSGVLGGWARNRLAQRIASARNSACVIDRSSKRTAVRAAIAGSVPLRRNSAAALAAGSSAVPGAGIERAGIGGGSYLTPVSGPVTSLRAQGGGQAEEATVSGRHPGDRPGAQGPRATHG